MKPVLHFFAMVIVAALLTGCNKNTPEKVAEKWLTGFNQMDFDAAMDVSTNETRNLLSSIRALTGGVSDSAKASLKSIKVSVKNAKVIDSIAIVTYTTSDNPREQQLALIKKKEQWLVQFTKTDLAGNVEANSAEEPVEEVPLTDTVSLTTDPAPVQ